ncbi:MAG: hypothetical protein ABFD96_20470, partial [Armatimonadia bacterium]
MAITPERLAEIREAVASPPWPYDGDEGNGWALCRDLLAEHDRLVGEVERLKPLAAIGSGVLAMADYERQGIFYGHRATLSVALYGDDSAVEEWLVNDCHLL